VPIPRESQGPGVSDFPDFSLNFSPNIFEHSPTIAPYYTYNVIMTENIDPIPDDLSACQELLRAVLVRLRDLERQLDEFVATTEELERSYACLKEEYLALKRLFFGPRRERLPEAAGQLHLFDAPPTLPDQSADSAPAQELPPRQPKKGHGRREIPDHLPRTPVLHDVPPEARVCDCGREKARIGEDVTEQLDYQPGKLFVLKHIYPEIRLFLLQRWCDLGQAVRQRPWLGRGWRRRGVWFCRVLTFRADIRIGPQRRNTTTIRRRELL
jgi:transposase